MRRQEGKKGLISDIFVIRRIAWTSKRQLSSLSLLSLTALCLWLNCMDVRTSPKTTACSRSGNRHLSINQSIITSNSLYPLFFLSHFHTQTVSIRDWTRKEVTGVSNKKKGCPTAPPGADRQCRDIFSLVRKKSQLSPSAPFTFVFVHASRGFKGKVVVFTPRMLCTFFFFVTRRVKKRNVQRNVT